MHFVSIILLGLAVSLDGFGVGLAYGVRSMKIPFISILIISFSSAMAVLLSMLTGRAASAFFPPEKAAMAGGMMLVLIGIWMIYHAVFSINSSLPREVEENDQGDQSQEETRNSQRKNISFVTDILKDPQKADFDKSGEISGREAVALGVALAIDAFGAGFGAAMMGFNPLTTSGAVGLTKMIMLPAGFHLGKYYLARCFGGRASYLSGVVLILLGLVNLFNIF